MVCPIFSRHRFDGVFKNDIARGHNLSLFASRYPGAFPLFGKKTNAWVATEQPFWIALMFNRQMALYLLLIAVMNFIYFMPTAV